MNPLFPPVNPFGIATGQAMDSIYGQMMPQVQGPLAPTPDQQAYNDSLLGRVGRGFNTLMNDPRRMAGLAGMAQGLLQAGAVSNRPISNAEAFGLASQGANQRLQQYDTGARQDAALGIQRDKAIAAQQAAQAQSAQKQNQNQFEQEYKLRTKFRQENAPIFQTTEATQRIVDAARDPSPAGDLAMIFNYMKVLDPGSVVRESEFATAQNAAGVPERIRSLYNNIIQGTRLTPSQRQDFLGRAEKLYQGQRSVLEDRAAQYKDMASRYGLDTQNVNFIDNPVDFSSVIGKNKSSDPNIQQQDIPTGPIEQEHTVGDKRYVKINGQWMVEE